MRQEPYRSGQRVFWVVDNGSSHRGQAACQRLTLAYPNLIVVHTPVHASWLNQVEIYFPIIQRKVLTPNAFTHLAEVEVRLRLYEELSNQTPRPLAWRFTREKLTAATPKFEVKRSRVSGHSNDFIDMPFSGYFASNFAGAALCVRKHLTFPYRDFSKDGC
jgi:hypothetical protein